MSSQTQFDEQLEKAKQCHSAGELEKAKKAYMGLSKEKPDNPQLQHLLGMVCFQMRQYDQSIEHLQNAIRLAPKQPLLYCHLGNAYKAKKSYAQSESAYLKSIQIEKTPLAFHNLGVLYHLQSALDRACHHYREAISLKPDYVDAHYHLAIALMKQGNLKEAISFFKTTIEMHPEHFGAWFYLGVLAMKKAYYQKALELFLKAEKIEKDNFELITNIGHCYTHLKEYQKAREYYRNALEMNINDIDIYYNLGVLAEKQGHFDHAINYYRDVLKENNDYVNAHHNIGIVYLKKDHPAYALKHFKEVLRLQPQNKTVQYYIDMLTQDTRLDAAPREYVKSLFNQYADHYDQHLIEALDYQVPMLFQNAFGKKTAKTCLDLGCGTGLCGVVFKDYVDYLAGVDISENMLSIAKEKGCYDKLYCQDINEFLENDKRRYDLILAGDVLVYFGKLENFFKAISQHLNKNGTFVFNIERSDKDDYQMLQSGRFAHHIDYLHALVKEYGFTIESAQAAVTRQQNNEPVNGWVVVARA
ncbi:MAG: tetratricopeptide repeat protein [Gammaproteobacteria bacterium]